MTAEIAILNKSAVALAADSAVTLYSGNNQKIYNTANKLFNLNKYYPIGIMIYNNADFMGIPWDTIIKVYRNEIKDKEFGTVEEQCLDFINYLENNRSIFSEDLQKQFVELRIRGLFMELKFSIEKKIEEETRKEPIKSEKVLQIVSEIITTYKKNFGNINFLNQFNEDCLRQFVEKYKSEIIKIKNEVFDKLPISSELLEILNSLAGEIFYKDFFLPNAKSGIVIVGFGKKEFLPSLIDFEVELIVDNKLKYKIGHKNFQVNGSLIQPYAQDEMARTFIEGINPDLGTTLISGLHQTINKINKETSVLVESSSLTDGEKSNLAKKLSEINKVLFDGYVNNIQQLIRTRYTEPVINSVTTLPKEELALMAESLVYLTFLRKRFSEEPETVGGEIDVAVISKGDGFIWIKRKHYFKPELNPHFFKNYFK